MAKSTNPFRYFDSSPEVIRLVVLMYVHYPRSLRNVEDLVSERDIDICHETVRLWWNRFGPMFAGEIRRKRVQHMRQFTHWKWRLDEVYVKINGETRYLWRAVDHEGDFIGNLTNEQFLNRPCHATAHDVPPTARLFRDCVSADISALTFLQVPRLYYAVPYHEAQTMLFASSAPLPFGFSRRDIVHARFDHSLARGLSSGFARGLQQGPTGLQRRISARINRRDDCQRWSARRPGFAPPQAGPLASEHGHRRYGAGDAGL